MATLERFHVDAEEKGNLFIIGLLEKQLTRLKMLFDRHVVRNPSGFQGRF
jgi:hypothetical protein